MFLSVTAYSLGSYWTTAGITYFEQAKQNFGLGQDDKLLGFFYIGYVAKPVTAISKRQPIQEKTKWVDSEAQAANTGFGVIGAGRCNLHLQQHGSICSGGT